MDMKTSFDTFLADIRPTDTQSKAMQRGHRVLRERLKADQELSSLIVGTFIQGSYRRSTAVRAKADERSDVDVVVVTRLKKYDPWTRTGYTANAAQAKFYEFADRHYKGKWRKQGRSIGIELSDVDVDLVITSAPSEEQEEMLKSVDRYGVQEMSDTIDLMKSFAGLSLSDNVLAKAATPKWKQEPLYIPNCDQDRWDPTHPLAQIEWTSLKNKSTNGHYVNVVKAIKWWRRIHPRLTGHPKGYPLEHMVGQCCPDGITSVAQGIVQTFANMVNTYGPYARLGIIPNLPDHGVPTHNVLGRLTVKDFQTFMAEVEEAHTLAKRALEATTTSESSQLWRELLGNKFPLTESNSGMLKQAGATSLSFPATPSSPKKPDGFA